MQIGTVNWRPILSTVVEHFVKQNFSFCTCPWPSSHHFYFITVQADNKTLFLSGWTISTDSVHVSASLFNDDRERERYWNAYLLFYARVPDSGDSVTPTSQPSQTHRNTQLASLSVLLFKWDCTAPITDGRDSSRILSQKNRIFLWKKLVYLKNIFKVLMR